LAAVRLAGKPVRQTGWFSKLLIPKGIFKFDGVGMPYA